MATKHHTAVSWSALASMLLALAIGSAPVAALLAFSGQMEALR